MAKFQFNPTEAKEDCYKNAERHELFGEIEPSVQRDNYHSCDGTKVQQQDQ